MGLNRKTCPAPARRGRVRITDLESCAYQLGGKIDLRAAEEFKAHLVDQNARPVPFDHQIVGIGRAGKIEFV
jgi:hypothetical protein